jgi:hypothetical protein
MTEIVRVYVCSLIAREGIHNLLQTWHAYALKPGKYFRNATTQKNVLGSSPGEGGFFSSEPKHDRIMAPRTELFRREDYTNKGHNLENLRLV